MSVFCDRVPPEAVVVDGYTLEDIRWLLIAVGEFASSGDIEAVHELLGFADPNLSADGLAAVAAHWSVRLYRLIEEAR